MDGKKKVKTEVTEILQRIDLMKLLPLIVGSAGTPNQLAKSNDYSAAHNFALNY